MEDYLRVEGIDPAAVDRFFYRKGLWRGETRVRMTDGTGRRLSFRKGYGLLQNLYVDCKRRCLSCPDHFAAGSDVSFGDAWLPELKGAPVKHSMAIAHTERGASAMDDLAREGAVLSPVDPALAVRAQKRAVIWHTYGAAGRARVGRLFGLSIPGGGELRPRWNDYLSACMILAAWRAYGSAVRPFLLRLPWPVPYAYMLAQKFFLNF
ncbi:MAG TPA: hypothetical protein ENO23_05145 [Alphaproteobacteria bacterium]|nr:hypothetical protein [Alphaproteobacteria bacterium]